MEMLPSMSLTSSKKVTRYIYHRNVKAFLCKSCRCTREQYSLKGYAFLKLTVKSLMFCCCYIHKIHIFNGFINVTVIYNPTPNERIITFKS